MRPGRTRRNSSSPPRRRTSLVCEGPEATALADDDYNGKPNRFGEEVGTAESSSHFPFGDGFTARDLTFRNDAGPVGRAVAVRVDGDRLRGL